jgi:1,4-dihydroxy-2-naphthoyl-CoA hydrolase
MTIWAKAFSLADLTALGRQTAAESCGIEFTQFGADWLEGTMPLDERTVGTDGSMHPGSLAILAETLGSVAANLCIDGSRQVCVGQILHLNHPVRVNSGPIRARASARIIQKDNHVWEVEMRDPLGAAVCVARVTMAVLRKD